MVENYEEAKRRIQEALEQNADHLYLDYLKLTELPPEFAELTSVTYLNMEHNRFETFPEVVLKLTQLEALDLEGNPTQVLPEGISELKRLKLLNFHTCKLQKLPDSFGDLVNLDYVDFTYNQLKTLPASFGKLSKLESISLVGNDFEDFPETFGKLSNLIWIEAGFNSLRELPESFVDLHKLETLDLSFNQLTTLPRNFSNISTLKTLNISGNPIAALPEELPTLEVLNIIHCGQITRLPPALKVTEVLKFGGQRLTAIPDGCKNAKVMWYSTEIEERMIVHPETITRDDVLNAKDHFHRETLLNLMEYDQLLHEIEMQTLNEMHQDEKMLSLVKIELPNDEAEMYLITVDRNHNHHAKWVLSKFQTCQEAFDWLHKKWQDS